MGHRLVRLLLLGSTIDANPLYRIAHHSARTMYAVSMHSSHQNRSLTPKQFMPLIIGLAGKVGHLGLLPMMCYANTKQNNLISYVTGFKVSPLLPVARKLFLREKQYEGLNLFHRWAGRLVLALSAVHIIGRVYVNVGLFSMSFCKQTEAQIQVPNIQLGAAGLINSNGGDHIEMVKWGIGEFNTLTTLLGDLHSAARRCYLLLASQ